MHYLRNKGGRSREDCASRLPAEAARLIAQRPTERWTFMHHFSSNAAGRMRSRLPAEAAVFHGLNGSYVVRKADVIVATQAWLRHDGRQWLEEIGTVFTEMLRKAEVLRFPGKWISRYFYFRYEFCLYINGLHSAGQRQRRDCCCI